MQTHESLVSLDELARLLRLSRRWLGREVAAGRLPFLQAGRRRVFNVTAVRQSLSERAKGESVVSRAK